MSYGNYETLVVERHGHVGWLINNRPDQLNAMNALMRDAGMSLMPTHAAP